MAKSSTFLTASFLVIFLHQSSAWPFGAPSYRCSPMSPIALMHGAYPSENPELYYSVVVNASTYTPGTNITVTINALTDEYRFKGFFIQAREHGEGEAVGDFEEESLPAQTKIVACNNRKGGVTQSERGNHNSLTFTWTPPATTTKNITFFATIVKEKAKYWVKHASQPISYKECIEEEETIESKLSEKILGKEETKQIKKPTKKCIPIVEEKKETCLFWC